MTLSQVNYTFSKKSFTFCSKFDIIEKEKGKQFGGGIK